jgi:hypothetical protein
VSEERLIKISKNLSEKEIIRLLNINAYYYIENVDLAPEHCMAAVKSNGSALKFIPKKCIQWTSVSHQSNNAQLQ